MITLSFGIMLCLYSFRTVLTLLPNCINDIRNMPCLVYEDENVDSTHFFCFNVHKLMGLTVIRGRNEKVIILMKILNVNVMI